MPIISMQAFVTVLMDRLKFTYMYILYTARLKEVA
jgi:hypothetical protein